MTAKEEPITEYTVQTVPSLLCPQLPCIINVIGHILTKKGEEVDQNQDQDSEEQEEPPKHRPTRVAVAQLESQPSPRTRGLSIFKL